MNLEEISKTRIRYAMILNFILWGLGGLILKRNRLDLLALLLHLYFYFIVWIFSLVGLWLIWFPVSSIGGAYFVYNISVNIRNYQ